MNMSVRADRVQVKSLALDPPIRSTPNKKMPDRAAVEAGRASLVMAVALGFGGILTLAWAGVLLWLAGYLIGFW